MIRGVDDCIDLPKPSYVGEERTLQFINDKYHRFAIQGIIYITKEAFYYLVSNEGLVDFPVEFLERIKIDGVYSLGKTVSQWTILSIAAMLGVGGIAPIQYVMAVAGYAWMIINNIQISRPHVQEVDKLTGKFVPRIATRKDAIVFDAKQELPPVIEQSVKPVRVTTLDTEYEITEQNLVDISKVSKLKNKFSDRRFKRPTKKAGKTVYFSDMVKKWRQEQSTDSCDAESIIDKIIRDGII